MSYYVSNGVTSTGINLSNNYLYVLRGGTANRTTVNSGGFGFVSSGGAVNSTTLNAGALTVSSGGTATSTTLNGGTLYVYSSGTANKTAVNGGNFQVSRGAATSTVISGGWMNVFGGTATSTTLNSGAFYVSSGGTATSTAINGGSMFVYNSGAANRTVMNGGYLIVVSGGAATSTAVNGGWVNVSSGAVANSITVNKNGYVLVVGGGTATTIVENGGYVEVAPGAKATFVANTFSKLAISSGSATLQSGTTATSTAVTDGALIVKQGGVANGVAVSGNGNVFVRGGGAVKSAGLGGGGRMRVSSGGSADGVIVSSAGTLYASGGAVIAGLDIRGKGSAYVLAGGKVTGAVTLAAGAVLIASAGAVVDFDVSTVAAGAAARVSNLSLIQGTPDFTVTVSASQAAGTYRLAQGAAGFAKTVTIRNANGALGSISVGNTVTLAGQKYTLNLAADALTLTVGGGSPAVPAAPVTPTGFTVDVSKYNVTLSWMKAAAPKGTKVSYEVSVNGNVVPVSGNKYTIRNAEVGNYTFAVRTVFSDGNRSAWTSPVAKKVADITAPKAGKVTLAQTPAGAVRVEWAAAEDNVGIDHYVVECTGGGVSKSYSGKALSAEFTGLPVGKVEATVTAFDAAGNESKTVKKTVTLKDVTPPAKVTGLASAGVDNKSGGTLTWKASTDNVGVAQYVVMVDGKTKYTSKTNSVKIRKLAAGEHTFTVVAVDKAKNASDPSAVGSFTVADVIDPQVKKLAAKVSGTSALVSWTATDNVGIGELKLSVDAAVVNVSSAAAGSYEVKGLADGIHRLRLEARDPAGNMAAKEISVRIKAPKNAAAPLLASIA